ncbi:MAG: hypothetical protein HQK51_02205 [Oligoflexia bacterium]|nr:hypothetical protein [Oligoflexia bacterium]
MEVNDLKHQLLALIPYVVNFVVFFGFIIYKIKRPLIKYFEERSEKIREHIESSNAKFVEANKKFKLFQEKINNSENECKNIINEAAKEVVIYKENAIVEMKNKIERMKRDMLDSFETEKLELIRQYDQQLLALVLTKSRNLIKGNENNKIKVSKNMLEFLH